MLRMELRPSGTQDSITLLSKVYLAEASDGHTQHGALKRSLFFRRHP